MAALALIFFHSVSPFSHSAIVFVIGFGRYCVYINTSDSKYNSLLFILDSVTAGKSRRPPLSRMPEAEQERGFVL